jgi:multidrug efflux system membrane fusion protein
VKVTLALETLKNVLTVPATAVQQRDERSTVFVVDAAGKAQLRDVTVREMRSDIAVIGSGLAPGERVVTGGLLRLTPGAAVKVQESRP